MIIGHEKTVSELQDLIGRGSLGHGYVFFGPSMTGKRTIALGLGHFLEKGVFDLPARAGDGTGTEVLQDLKVIDVAFMRSLNPDASGDSIGIDAVREIRNFLWQRPNASSRRMLIIDNADLLTTEAQNALLKMTEEPPASSLLILVTSDPDGILPTILSRLPRIYFGAVPEAAIAQWLAERLQLPKAKAAAFAKRALGKPGLASRLASDEAFRSGLELAERFLKAPAASRRDFIKKVIEPDDFNLRNFLDAVIITLAWEAPSRAKAAFWHKTLRLCESANNFSLNPRLQLEALLR